MGNHSKRAIVLFSGGLDSATALGVATSKGYECLALSFWYGQKHEREVKAAENVVNFYQTHRKSVAQIIQEINFKIKPWSALTSGQAVPDEGYNGGIPATYVPARNTLFLAFAASLAETVEAEVIFTGFNALDYSGYPDCRPEYVLAMQNVLNIGTKAGAEGHASVICAPLIGMTKVEILRKAIELGVPHELTWSCYNGGLEPCHKCDSCRFRDAAYAEVLPG